LRNLPGPGDVADDGGGTNGTVRPLISAANLLDSARKGGATAGKKGGNMKNQTLYWLNGVILVFVLAFAPVTVQAKVEPIITASPEGNIPAPVLSPKEIAVCHALLMLPYYGVFDNLEFRVDGDKVELLGQVTRPVLASDAQRAVAQVSGVNQVINHVEVLPLSPNDDRIRLSVYRKVYGSSSMLPYAVQPVPPIRIIVKNGQVTLEGVVSRPMDKILANMEANSVAGVFSVTNNLHVQS